MPKKKLILTHNPLLSGPNLSERERLGIPYRVLKLDLIDRDANQPRRNFAEDKLQELAQSIRTYGVLSPILVRPGKTIGRYTLISGERRLKAAQIAGLTSIPALVDQEEDSSQSRTLSMQLVENLQRMDLTPLERAHAIGALRDGHGLSVREIADRLGVSKSMVQRSLEILELPDDLMNALKEGASESKILLLAKIEDPEIRASYLKDLESLTRRQLEVGINRIGKQSKIPTLSSEDRRITDEIQRALGLKVKLTRPSADSESGKITIDFYSTQDLQEIFRRLVAEG